VHDLCREGKIQNNGHDGARIMTKVRVSTRKLAHLHKKHHKEQKKTERTVKKWKGLKAQNAETAQSREDTYSDACTK
jgi:hypothetical protein